MNSDKFIYLKNYARYQPTNRTYQTFTKDFSYLKNKYCP